MLTDRFDDAFQYAHRLHPEGHFDPLHLAPDDRISATLLAGRAPDAIARAATQATVFLLNMITSLPSSRERPSTFIRLLLACLQRCVAAPTRSTAMKCTP
jgi:hypothetical protein